MTTLTITTVLIIVLGAVGPRGYGLALALGGVTSAGAAVVAGTTAVPTFYAIAIGCVAAMALRLLAGPTDRNRPTPALGLLLAFLVCSVVVTLCAPMLFDGLLVHAATGPARLASGSFTSSNIAQIVYLVLGVATVAFLGRSRSARPELIAVAAGGTTLLSAWRYLHEIGGLPFPDGFFDNSPFFTFIETSATNTERFRGILSEPAGLASSSLVTIAYMVPRAMQLGGWRRVGAWLMAGVAAYLGIISTSATFVVAGVAVALLAVAVTTGRFLGRRSAIGLGGQLIASVIIITVTVTLPVVADFVQHIVDAKVRSSSFGDRSSFDQTSYRLFLDTFGFGVGLGSNRASSFVAGLLSTTGLVGTVLFVAAIVGLVRRGARLRRYRPVAWALTALLVAKVIAGPDLSDPSGILWISLGLLSHATLLQRSRAEQPLAQNEAGRKSRATTS